MISLHKERYYVGVKRQHTPLATDRIAKLFLFFCCLFISSGIPAPQLGSAQQYSYTNASASTVSSASTVARSPKTGWSESALARTQEDPWWSSVLWYLPNRILDALDVIRVDVGVGPAVGGVVRTTHFAQAGWRQLSPFSVRVGAFGRRAPFLVETSNEFGISPAFVQSKQREICYAELGLGLDLGVGAYGGICLAELGDFVLGIFTIDMMGDDFE